MKDIYTAAQRWHLLKLTMFPLPMYRFPASEVFRNHISYNLIHNLDTSRLKKIPERWYDALLWVHFNMYAQYGDILMTKPRSNNRSRDDMPELVQNKLTPEELTDFGVWVDKNAKKIETLIPETILEGYKLGVSWDAYNNCWIATLTGKGDKCINDYRVLTARADDYYEVQAMLIYKHIEVYHRGKWENRNSGTRG